jgi:hypothetical protein
MLLVTQEATLVIINGVVFYCLMVGWDMAIAQDTKLRSKIPSNHLNQMGLNNAIIRSFC